jgi:hypothetical protein
MCITICVFEDVTLLEFEQGLLEAQQQVQEPEGQSQETGGEGGADQEELLECPEHHLSLFLKDKPRSIISLPYFTKP